MILTSLPSPLPSLVHAAKRRLPATVALDLRLAGRAAAVAIDRRGELVAWAVLTVPAGGDSVALARRALRELGVRPREVRVLVGAGEAQVAFLAQTGAPGADEIAAALFAEGYERLREPAVAALAVSPETWLVAACGAGTVEPLAAGLLEESGTEPLFVVDQLLAAASLEAGSARVESGETGLLIVAAPPGSPLVVRFLPALSDVEEAARESLESLQAAGIGVVQVLGPQRTALARFLGESRLSAYTEALPASGGETLPAACDLAWELVLRSAPPRLASPRSERRRTGLAWARRTIRFAMVTAVLGGLLMAAGLRLTWLNRERSRSLVAQTAADARLVPELREIGALADEVDRLRAGLAGQTAPWPRLAEPVAALARQLPPGVGWERLQVKDGVLELEAAAVGEAPFGRLEILRHTLERSPALVNLSWATPVADPHRARLRQIFRATVKGTPAAAPQGEP
jgi:hypothetical protein